MRSLLVRCLFIENSVLHFGSHDERIIAKRTHSNSTTSHRFLPVSSAYPDIILLFQVGCFTEVHIVKLLGRKDSPILAGIVAHFEEPHRSVEVFMFADLQTIAQLAESRVIVVIIIIIIVFALCYSTTTTTTTTVHVTGSTPFEYTLPAHPFVLLLHSFYSTTRCNLVLTEQSELRRFPWDIFPSI